MSISELTEFLEGLGVSPVYPLAMPASAPDRAYMVESGQGFSSKGSVADVIMTVISKAEHPSESERMGMELIDLLDKKTDAVIGGHQVILIKSQQIIPDYLGKSAEGYHYHMNNFKVLVND